MKKRTWASAVWDRLFIGQEKKFRGLATKALLYVGSRPLRRARWSSTTGPHTFHCLGLPFSTEAMAMAMTRAKEDEVENKDKDIKDKDDKHKDAVARVRKEEDFRNKVVIIMKQLLRCSKLMIVKSKIGKKIVVRLCRRDKTFSPHLRRITLATWGPLQDVILDSMAEVDYEMKAGTAPSSYTEKEQQDFLTAQEVAYHRRIMEQGPYWEKAFLYNRSIQQRKEKANES